MEPRGTDLQQLADLTLRRLVPHDGATRQWLAQACRLRTAEPGGELLTESEEVQLGILLSGRLETAFRTLRPGTAFGEEPFLGRDRHEPGFRAARTSVYLSLSLEDFDRGLALHPTGLMGFLRQLSQQHPPASRAVWTLGSGCESLIKLLPGNSGATLLMPQVVDEATTAQLAALEQHHERVFLVDGEVEGWNEFCAAQSDGSLSLKAEGPWLVPVSRAQGEATFPGLPGRLRIDDPEAWARLVRLLTGGARGQVLSGGGARGFAHIGELKALCERKLAPDSVGGASMGALIACLWAVHQDVAVLEDLARDLGHSSRVPDWTMGATSLTSGLKVARLLEGLFGDLRFEDLPLPAFSLATDLTAAREVVFTSGRLQDAVRASLAIPGVFYPVVRGGEILVDGGLMNNLPIDVLAQRLPLGQLLAVDVTAADWETETGWIGAPSAARRAWDQVWDQLHPSHAGKVPSLADLLVQSLEVNSRRRYRETSHLPHRLLAINVTGFDPLDFGNWKRLINEGYRQACLQLDKLDSI